MTLLGRPGLVLLQNGVNHAHPRTKLGPTHRLLPLIPRRRRIRQHLPHRLARQTELPCYRPLALALDKGCTPHSRIQFHRIHPSGVPRIRLPLIGSEQGSYLVRYPLGMRAVRETRIRRWSTFTPPRHAAAAAPRGLFSLRRSYVSENSFDMRNG